MVIPIFISSQYKDQKDKDGTEWVPESIVDGVPADLPSDSNVRISRDGSRSIRYRHPRQRRICSPWMALTIMMMLLTLAVFSFVLGNYLMKRYGGTPKYGWCKLEYTVQGFNNRAKAQQLEQVEKPASYITDEWIRLNEDSWELSSTGEFNYNIVTDLETETSALKIEGFIGDEAVCFVGSRYDFGLPSYVNIQAFLDSLQDKAEILVDHVHEITFLDISDELPQHLTLDPSIERLCQGARRFAVSAINPDNEPEVKEMRRVEEIYYAANNLMNAFQSGTDLSQLMSTLERFQEVMAYVPSGDYVAEFPGGKVVSFEIRRPQSMVTSGSAGLYPFNMYGTLRDMPTMRKQLAAADTSSSE